ncbi:hypothetical protein PVAP13_5KG373000 [Panicum virgatum]|uniref:Uncharacterized protein n=1 Tax=Panicum virgatum TaxID=38727 RepID=A0A8T0SL87_PANVG|nr:hypothetical protein PVAP13_5KG373000 [Panicum virgatum]
MAKIERSLGHVTTISHPYDFDLTRCGCSILIRLPTQYSRAPSPRGSRRIYVYPPARNELVARELVNAELLCPRLMPLLRGRCSDAALLGRRPTGGTAAKKMYAADLRPPLLHPPSCSACLWIVAPTHHALGLTCACSASTAVPSS